MIGIDLSSLIFIQQQFFSSYFLRFLIFHEDHPQVQLYFQHDYHHPIFDHY